MILNPVIASGNANNGYDLTKPTLQTTNTYTLDGSEKAIYAETSYKGRYIQLLMDFQGRWEIRLDQMNYSSGGYNINAFDPEVNVTAGDPTGAPDTGVAYTARRSVEAQTIKVYK